MQTMRMKNILFLFLMAVVIAAALYSCSSDDEAIEPGSICTVKDTTGQYRVAKVLVLDDDMVHIMLFKKRYPQRPATIGPDDLELRDESDSAAQEGPLGELHVALMREQFMTAWQPVVVAFEKVVDEDLEGYKLWKTQQE